MIQRQAHAKINLTLDVLFRREDGFHEIESIFQTVSLDDGMHLQVAGENRLTSEGWEVPLDESNSCLKAVQLFQSVAQWPPGIHLYLLKQIPTQAGLGGGSSDAATILTCLAELSKSRGIAPPPLMPLAAQIGSDVPFFLHGGCARVHGRGEHVQPLKPLPLFYGVLAMPEGVGVPTAWAYEQLNRPPQVEWEKGSTCTETLLDTLQTGKITDGCSLAGYLANDFEEPILKALEPLQRLRERMERLGALRVLLCGSGAAQFALCSDEAQAKIMARKLSSDGYWANVVRNV
jgi:4-diphosphocytidyl-2-C-methyl-D-erythritol kinase